MKYLMIAVCVLSVGWAVVNRVGPKKVDQAAEVPANAGPTYVSMESNGPVFRLTPDTRKELDRYSAEKVVMFGATWCGYCAANRKIFAERGVHVRGDRHRPRSGRAGLHAEDARLAGRADHDPRHAPHPRLQRQRARACDQAPLGFTR